MKLMWLVLALMYAQAIIEKANKDYADESEQAGDIL